MLFGKLQDEKLARGNIGIVSKPTSISKLPTWDLLPTSIISEINPHSRIKGKWITWLLRVEIGFWSLLQIFKEFLDWSSFHRRPRRRLEDKLKFQEAMDRDSEFALNNVSGIPGAPSVWTRWLGYFYHVALSMFKTCQHACWWHFLDTLYTSQTCS